MQRVIEEITGEPLDASLQKWFYAPLGLPTLGYKPLERFPLERIVPTEVDDYFRKQLVHGDVHDPAAAMLGGIAGHAGLFSSSFDLAVIMQMMLEGGTYGNMRYLKESTVKLFTTKQYEGNRKALGWDRINDDNPNSSPASRYASSSSFGHQGFTGTIFWADPEYDLTYIFLSNRVYPSAADNKLAKSSLRTKIHNIIYESIATAM